MEKHRSKCSEYLLEEPCCSAAPTSDCDAYISIKFNAVAIEELKAVDRLKVDVVKLKAVNVAEHERLGIKLSVKFAEKQENKKASVEPS